MTGGWGRAGRSAGFTALLCCAATLLPGAAGGALQRGLPSAETILPHGVEDGLLTGGPKERVRVGVVLAAQPVLAQTTKPSFEAALTGYTRGDLQRAGRRSPHRVSRLEVQAARVAKRRRAILAGRLRDEVLVMERLEADLAEIVEQHGGRVVRNAESGPLAMVTVQVARWRLGSLADHPAVQAVIRQPALRQDLDTSTTTIAASSVWNTHNGGTGPADVRPDIEVGMAGDSPDPDHSAFDGIAIDIGSASPANHGTANAGVLSSRDSAYRGVAHGISAIRGGNADTFTAANPVDVRNQSFGYDPVGDHDANVPDLVAHTYLLPWVGSAGNYNYDSLNDQPYPDVTPGSPTTGGNAMGRNILSAGAFGDNSTVTPSDDLVASFSSFGPTPGGRKKPDLTAPGVGITGPAIGGGIDTHSGTSLSAPHIAGAQAILVGAGLSDPRVIRALLINSADPWCNGHNHNPPAGASLTASYPPGTCQDRWLPDVGWGELDVEDAVTERGNAVIGDVEGGKARFYRATIDPGDRATLAWNMRGVLGEFVHEHVYFTVTNLNLRQYRPGGTEITPLPDPGWGAGPDAIDPNDTVEQVRGPNPAGEIVYKVQAASTVEGAPTERFGLAASKPLVPLESPDVRPVGITRSDKGAVNCTSDTVEVAAKLHNPSSDIAADAAQLTIELSSGLTLVSGAATQAIPGGTLAEDATSAEMSWTVRATDSGTHSLAVRGEGTAFATTFTNRERLTPLEADCSPPQVIPRELAVTPAAEVACGEPQTITARFRNPTRTDAPRSRAEISLPIGATLVAGSQMQTVAGGTLARGEISEQRSWQFRLPDAASGGSLVLAGLTDFGGETVRNSTSFGVSCVNDDPGLTPKDSVRLRGARLEYRRRTGKLVARGRVAGSDTPLTGRARVKFRKPGGRKRTRRDRLGRKGRFAVRINACRRGTYRAWVTWPGSATFAPLERTRIGTLRVRGC